MAFLPMNAKEMSDRAGTKSILYMFAVTAMLTIRHSVRQ